jgi:hypothetical protein
MSKGLTQFEQMAADAKNGTVIAIAGGSEVRVRPFANGMRRIQIRTRGGKWETTRKSANEEHNAEDWALYRAQAEAPLAEQPQQRSAETALAVVNAAITPQVMQRMYTPAEVDQAWNLALGGLRNIVCFGAMLMELDSCLTRETAHQRNQYSGETLKAWLSANCPGVNYKTAMRFKSLASAALIGSGETLHSPDAIAPGEVPLLLGSDQRAITMSDDERLKRTALERFLEGKSQRDVFAALRGPGRPKGTPGGGRRALTALERTADAELEIRELLGKLAAFAQGPKLLALPQEIRQQAATHMKDLARTFMDKG